MTAAMDCLANTHGITLSFMKSIGGKDALLQEFPTIKEQVGNHLMADVKLDLHTFICLFTKVDTRVEVISNK